jgi:O-antigen/teichoic acid export membrane protein
MIGQDVLRSAMGHVRTPVYLNAYALIVSNLLTSGLGIVYWGFAARLYAVEVVGVSAAVTSLLLFLSGISQLNLRVALLRLVPEAGAGTRRLVVWAYGVALAVTALVSLVVYVGGALLGSAWTALPGLTEPAGIALLVLGTVGMSLFNLQDGVIAGLRRTVWVPLENGSYAVGKIVLLVALAAVLPALGIVASYTLPTLVAVAVVSVVLFRRWIPAHEAASADRAIAMGRRRVLGFVAADSVGAMFALASTTLIPVLVLGVAGPEQGAYFSMAWAVVVALGLFPTNMAASMTVETIHSGADPGQELRRLARHMARVLLPLLLAVELLAPFILRVFGQAYADNATDLLRIASLGLVPMAVNALALAIARVEGRGRDILLIQASIALLTLAVGALLLPLVGLVGVAVAWVVAQSAVAVASWWRELRPVLRSTTRG